MRLIQPILLAALLCLFFVYLRFLRSTLRDRVLALIFFLLASAAVVVPDSTQRLAHMVGVGRGTDLTFYLFAVAFSFSAVLTYSRLSRVSRSLTEVVRRIAILEAQRPNQPEPAE